MVAYGNFFSGPRRADTCPGDLRWPSRRVALLIGAYLVLIWSLLAALLGVIV